MFKIIYLFINVKYSQVKILDLSSSISTTKTHLLHFLSHPKRCHNATEFTWKSVLYAKIRHTEVNVMVKKREILI